MATRYSPGPMEHTNFAWRFEGSARCGNPCARSLHPREYRGVDESVYGVADVADGGDQGSCRICDGARDRDVAVSVLLVPAEMKSGRPSRCSRHCQRQ